MQQSIRAVRFPLKLKFTLTLGILLSGTLATFLWLASTLIRQDKTAYVYDAILLRTEQQAAALQAKLLAWQALTQKNLSAEELSSQFPEVLADFAEGNVRYQARGVNETQISSWSALPQAAWQIPSSPKGEVLILDAENRRLVIDLTPLTGQKDSPFILGLYTLEGKKLLGPKDEAAVVAKDHWLWGFIEKPTPQGVQEVKGDWIVAYSKISGVGWILTSKLSKSDAFAVAGYLIDKSLFFGLMILGFAILVGILAVRPLTKQLEDLGLLTSAIGSGDFSGRIQPRTHDEAGALADSFNLMSEQITQYMQEMKEKARLENELHVAQLVQKAFFPENQVKLKGVDIQAFNAPASECGGDWWGYLDMSDTTILFIADATGHGVSAALLTATANACKEGVKALAELDPTFLQSPARIMHYFNRTVCSSGDQIHMTCFVATYHRPSRSLQYANASHQPALIYVAPKDRAPSKEDLRPLLEANGPRLGQQKDAVYTENYVELPAGARMVLYTDGLTEATSPEGQAFGQRRFMKALLETLTHDGSPGPVIEAMNAFHQSEVYEDDVTLVCARFS